MATVGEWQKVSESRLELGEGARWLDGRFVLVDLLSGDLFETAGTAASDLRLLHHSEITIGAVAPVTGGWIAAAGDGILLISDDGDEEWVARPAERHDGSLRMNDAATSSDGRFWAGVMNYESTPGDGFLVCVDAARSVTRVIDDLAIPNGPAFSPDGRTMYLADTPTGEIYSYDLRADGSIGTRDVFAHVTNGVPDGMTVDVDGFLWSAIWGGSRLHRYSPSGELVEQIPVPACQPTSIALSTVPPYRIIVTSALVGLDEPGEHDGQVLTAPVSVGGCDVPFFTD